MLNADLIFGGSEIKTFHFMYYLKKYDIDTITSFIEFETWSMNLQYVLLVNPKKKKIKLLGKSSIVVLEIKSNKYLEHSKIRTD